MTYSKTIKCPKCGNMNESVEAIEIHGKQQYVNPTDCSHCGLVFSQYYGLKYASLKPESKSESRKSKKERKKVPLKLVEPDELSQKQNDSSPSQKAEIEIVVVHQDDRDPKPHPEKAVKPVAEQSPAKQKSTTKTKPSLPPPVEPARQKNFWVIKWINILSWFCLIPGITMGVIKLSIDIIRFNTIDLMTIIMATKYMAFGVISFLFFKWMVLITQTLVDMRRDMAAVLSSNNRRTK